MTILEFQRRKLGLTQEQLGSDPRVKIGAYFISLLEQGRALPGGDQLIRLGRKLGVAPEDLLKPAVLDLPTPEEPTAETAERG